MSRGASWHSSMYSDRTTSSVTASLGSNSSTSMEDITGDKPLRCGSMSICVCSVPQYYLLGVFLLLQLLITPLIEGDRLVSASSEPLALPVPVLESDGRAVVHPAESSTASEIQQSFASKCPLCLGVCTQATSISCGHVFCWKCIAEWVQEKEECPLCRTDTKLQSLVPIYHADF